MAASTTEPQVCIHIGYRRTGTSYLTGVFHKICDRVQPLPEHPELLERFLSVTESDSVTIPIFELADGSLLCPWNEILADLDSDRLDRLDRLARDFPSAKIIVTLRNQTALLRGTYFLWVKSGNTGTFPQFVSDRAHQLFRFDSVVDRLCQRFGEQRVLVILHEDLLADPAMVVRDIAAFCGNGHLSEAFEVETTAPVKPTASDFVIRLWELRNRLLRPLDRAMPAAAGAIRRAGLPGHGILEKNARLFGEWSLIDQAAATVIDRAYGNSNQALFERLGKPLSDYAYPGSART